MKLHLIRHGESEANVDNSIYYKIADFEIELTPRGINQSIGAANSLLNSNISENTLIVHSPWKRAFQTAVEINKTLNLQIIENPLIYEQFYKPSKEAYNEYFTSYTKEALNFSEFWYKQGSMESVNDCYHRAVQFYNQLKTGYYKNDELIIVSHGMFLKCFYGVCNKLSVKEIIAIEIDNCQIITVDI